MNTRPRFNFPRLSTPVKILLSAGTIVVIVAAYFFIQYFAGTHSRRTAKLLSWLQDPQSHAGWVLEANTRCGDAPFQMPTRGYIGFVWGDSFQVGHRHQGLDIFGGAEVNETPVYAAYPGYLTRLDVWKSSIIIRIPEDPLKPSRQIWTYYTHMADSHGNSFISSEIPPGTSEVYVEAGTLLGYQGNYSGDPVNPTGVHLHFSIVLDNGSGKWLNELEKKNTLDPSPYFKMELNSSTNPDRVPLCPSSSD